MDGDQDGDLERLEQRLLLEGVCEATGFDFRDYAPMTLRRRVMGRVRAEGLASISALQERALHDPDCMRRLLAALTTQTTSMFRDPTFYLAFRRLVVPLLDTHPFVRLWHAGCSTGEEVYSMAILLHEEGLGERCRIYATDLSEAALDRARRGVFPLASMKEYTDNYLAAGGAASFSEYYTASSEHALVRPWLGKNVVFAQHSLVTDGSFNEFHAILCRNVMIYFNKALQGRAHGILYDSLCRGGVLALGAKESLRFTPHERSFEELDGRERLYRKVG